MTNSLPFLKRQKVINMNDTSKKANAIKITKFEIRNYRSCSQTSLSPNSGLTALIGVNGSGKSNLLSAILLLKRASRGSSHMHLSKGDKEYLNRSYISAEIDFDSKLIKLRGEIFYFTNNQNIDEVMRTTLLWNLESIDGFKAWTEFPIEAIMFRDDYSYFRYMRRRDFMHKQTRSSHKADEQNLLAEKRFPFVRTISEYLGNINYYSASQFSDPSRCPVSLELEDDRPRSRMERVTIDHEKFIFDLYRSNKRSTVAFQRYINVVGNDGIGLVDNVRFDEIALPSDVVEVRAGGKTIKKERTKLIVVPIFSIAGKELSPNQLSEGTFKTLALLFYVLTDDSRLLLVEEPEVCIHHGLLTSIITIIKEESKDKQIVISTHSDYVLDQLAPENVVLVDRKGTQGTKARPVNKTMSKTDFKALKKYLEESGNLGEYWREGGLVDE